MKTILDILSKAGGWHPGLYLKIDNPPYMELVIEAMDESGPCGLPSISVAHYGKQNPLLITANKTAMPCSTRDVLRAWLCWRPAPEPVLLAQRLCRHRGVEPLHSGRQLLLSPAASRAARGIRQDMGQEPAFPRFRRSLHRQVHSRLVPCPLERNTRSRAAL